MAGRAGYLAFVKAETPGAGRCGVKVGRQAAVMAQQQRGSGARRRDGVETEGVAWRGGKGDEGNTDK